MCPTIIHIPTVFPQHVPMVDSEFDSFDLIYELESDLRETETANFYHDAIDRKD